MRKKQRIDGNGKCRRKGEDESQKEREGAKKATREMTRRKEK